MRIDFLRPWWLTAIPLIIIFIYFTANTGQKSFRRDFLCVLRSSVCILLILAMSGMGFKYFTDTTTTIFAADISASMERTEKSISSFIKEAVKHKSEKDFAGVVAFGKNAVVEVSPAKEIFISGFNSYVEKGGTDIEKALKTSVLLTKENSEKRIVIISDGNETISSAMKAASELSLAGIRVDGVYVENVLEKEVQITDIKTPDVMDKNTQFDVEVVVHSILNTIANIKIFKGSDIIVNTDANLSKGENRFLFSDISSVGGGIVYRGEISSTDDTMTENNKAFAYTYVEDVPSVLIIENQEESGREIGKILEKSSVAVKRISVGEVPLNLEQLNLWDSVILADVSAEDMSLEFLTALEAFVKTAGGGLIAIGGENSFALGAYQSTVLNEVLPVSMELKTEGEKSDLGMVMIIDRSGSMTDAQYGVSRMEMAKEAAMRAVEVMEAEDTIGVIAFDDRPVWAVPIGKIGSNGGSISKEIGKIQPGGGTSILPALKEGFNVLKNVDTKTKHIILLTDGQAEQTGYDSLIESMKEKGITLSTVAVGGGADTKLLQSLAEKGRGRYYFTNEFTDLPRIFTKETSLAGKEYINNRSFYPQAVDKSDILKGIESVPKLKGYISTTGKPRADIVLQSDKEEPILAAWQYGTGRAAAWTSDASGRWSDEWLLSDEGVAVLRNMISWSIRGGISSEISFSAQKDGNTSLITAKMPYDESIKEVDATILSSEGKEIKTIMKSQAPGIYTAQIEDLEQGGYIISLDMKTKDDKIKTSRGGFVITYPKEYDLRSFSGGKETLERLVEATGGRIIEEPYEVFKDIKKTVLKTRDISVPLTVAALILFILEVAVRRVWVLSDNIEMFFRKLFRQKHEKVLKKTSVEVKTKEKTAKAEKVKEEIVVEKKASTAETLARNKKSRKQ